MCSLYTVVALLLCIAPAVRSTTVGETLMLRHKHRHRRHHHRRHHVGAHNKARHPHDDNGEIGHDTYTVNKVSYEVASNSTIIHLPATAEEKSSVDAVNAYNAAESAKQAAQVASHVAVHSAEVKLNAQEALEKARGVLKDARTETSGLRVDQADALRRAEKRLSRASEVVDYNVTSRTARASDKKALEYKLDKLSKDTSGDDKNELARMQVEIEQLRHKLNERRLKEQLGTKRREMEASEQELAQLETMIKDLEASETHGKIKPSEHDEMKIEVERLRNQISSLESSGSPDTGTLTYEIPPKRELPLRTVKSVGDGDGESEESLESAAPPQRPTVGNAGAGEPCDDASSGIDIDTEMPYGELEPFGREDTAQELTEDSVKESDEMVDQLERAQVAEEKRAVFRALTRLRGAAITSFDGIARSLAANVDEYNKMHHWRQTHPLHHLAQDESDISKWAFPDNADF